MAISESGRPDGFHSVNPFLVVRGAAALLDFLETAFDAVPVGERFAGPDGRIMHAAVRIGDSMVEVGESPDHAQPANLHFYVDDPDETYRKALAAGATSIREPETTFYGERSAGVQDPSGNSWWLARVVENLTPEEMAQRQQAGK